MVKMRCVDDFKNKEAKIKVIGVGGGGGNAVNRMIESQVKGVEFVALNTDAQVLKNSQAAVRVQIGEDLTKGLGVGGDPSRGKQAAVESEVQIKEMVSDCDLLFITAGMGGGTGTGAAPVVAEIAKEHTNALVVGVVTRPFGFEGSLRAQQAEDGIIDMRKFTDCMLIIPNDRLLSISDSRTEAVEAYKMADDVLRQAIQGISDVITSAGDINVDFADVRKIMAKSGEALIGIGAADGPDRHMTAAKKAIDSPLLENAVIDGAKGILVNFTSSRNMLLHELSQAMDYIKKVSSSDALIKYGQAYDDMLGRTMKITVIATGFSAKKTFKRDMAINRHSKRRCLGDMNDFGFQRSFYRNFPEDAEDIDKPAYLRRRGSILK